MLYLRRQLLDALPEVQVDRDRRWLGAVSEVHAWLDGFLRVATQAEAA